MTAGAAQSDVRDFDEWMVTKALAAHLATLTADKQVEWFGALDAKSGTNSGQLRELFPTLWPTGEISGAPEKPFTLTDAEDIGSIPADEFKKIFEARTPDFRYWAKHRDRQLILEAKGTDKPSARDADQARRYFEYLLRRPAAGAVIYLVMQKAAEWYTWLQKIAIENNRDLEATNIGFAVVELNDKVLASIAPELIRVVGESLVKAASLLDKAFRLGK
jgi:hypothetical protein